MGENPWTNIANLWSPGQNLEKAKSLDSPGHPWMVGRSGGETEPPCLEGARGCKATITWAETEPPCLERVRRLQSHLYIG